MSSPIPKTDNINCRLVGGPSNNLLIFQEKYHPTIMDVGYNGIVEYVDSGILNTKNEHLFFYDKYIKVNFE